MVAIGWGLAYRWSLQRTLRDRVMRRREFIGFVGGAVAWPAAVRAQRITKWRIGVLETVGRTLNEANFKAFTDAMVALGRLEGKEYEIEHRSADGEAKRFPELAADLVALNVDLILTRGTPAALAAKRATATIPIVMAAIGEPIGTGVVASLAHPGGNVTGFSALVTELASKRVQLIKEIAPHLKRVGFLNNMANPVIPPQLEETKRAAAIVGVQVELLDVRNREDIARVFESATARRVEGLLVGVDAVTQQHRLLIVALAELHRLPVIYASREQLEDRGLMSYGVSYPDLYRRAAGHVDKVFNGTRPSDIPVEQPTKLELVVNMQTAKALGLTVPPSLLVLADEVIE
jgi:putative tryptophan/tyrosine transport system substrate-binding protein